MKIVAFVAVIVALVVTPASAAPSIAFVPLDDRPVTFQLPVMLGNIAGVPVVTPPRATLGRYLQPGDPEAIARWLGSPFTADAFAFVVSTDMVVYGGLVASRVPGVSTGLAYSRLRDLVALRAQRPAARFLAFATVMRLAPTGVPALGPAKTWFASGEAWPLVQQYANLPDPPVTEADRAKAERLRARLGPTLDAYLATRARNRDVDLFALQLLAEGGFDLLVLGQDDAGAQGLHIRDLAALRAFANRWERPGTWAIEPGADELGMTLVGNALASRARWTPKVRVVYSRPDGATFRDPLEFAPIDTTIGDLIVANGGTRVTSAEEIALFVKVPKTSATDEAAFEAQLLAAARGAAARVAVADLSFLGEPIPVQQELTQFLIAQKIAGTIDAFASWNTTANTVGTAIPAAIACGAGRRLGTYNDVAHAQFMLDRYADDYAFHTLVRPAINGELDANGVSDHTYLLPDVAARTASSNRAALWSEALALLASIYPEYRDAGLTITLPWDRTFETQLDVRVQKKT